MKIIRSAMWKGPTALPTAMAFMGENDVKNFPEAVHSLKKPLQGLFTALEVFEMEGIPSMPAIVMFGTERYYKSELARIERDQAMLYFYNAMMCGKMSSAGAGVNSIPHPLTAPQIAAVFEQLAVHPLVKPGHKLMGFGTDYRMVTLYGGKVTINSGVD